MTSAGDGFSWPFQDPQWASKILVQGLITLIPIVGWIATTGWLVLTIDNYRTGRRELPPYGFHLERGIVLFVVYVVYVIVFGIPGGIIDSVGVIFTLPYSAAIVAGIVTWYEHITSGPATAGPATAPPQSPPPPPPAPLPS